MARESGRFDPAKSKGLGMKIVQSLVEQVGGELHIASGDDGHGARFTVTFCSSMPGMGNPETASDIDNELPIARRTNRQILRSSEKGIHGYERAAGGHGRFPLRPVFRSNGNQSRGAGPERRGVELRTYVCAECGHSQTYSVARGRN